jgi:hypothetical protein
VSVSDSRQAGPTPEEGLRLTIKLWAERSRALRRLSEKERSSIDDLAKSYLEAEIEAQHGLVKGPFKRRFLYRA